MSGPAQNVGRTLTGGIQDVAALLPLLGTDQCEQHVGSALDGGYLYAAAAPLSIFGSLGIVKVGISVLISSISITIPKISVSLHPFSINISQERWLGARTLNNAGFKPAGTVAPLIAMDGKRYKAETRLMQILEEKHIDRPENLLIDWKSRRWNVMLALTSTMAAVISGTPYIALLLQNSQPTLVHSPWIFPLLRTVGSCLAAVSCQFLIQTRVIYLMKNRIILTVMDRLLTDDPRGKPWLIDEHLQWDAALPAEQCLWNLEQYLSPQHLSPELNHGPNEQGSHLSIEIKPPRLPDSAEDIHSKLQRLRNDQFLTPGFDKVFVLTSWIVLFLSLPATVAGYIGCFTLVSNAKGNGPFLWLGLEASLSIVRILVWAWNPSWDEETITVKLKLTKDQPLVTTDKSVEVIKSTGNILVLVPEHQFLEWITPYTGPMEQFRSSENLALYLTLTAISGSEQKRLYMTVFHLNKQIAVTIYLEDAGLMYVDADVTCNRITSEMEAELQSMIGEQHPWRTNNANLFNELAKYYESIIHALNWKHPDLIAALQCKWNLDLHSKGTEPSNQHTDKFLKARSLRDQLYLDRGYEHHLKTELIENWGEWIVKGINSLRSDALHDCYYAVADPASMDATRELEQLDAQLAWEWTRRELLLLSSSTKLEDILERRMGECISKAAGGPGNERLKEWMWSKFVSGRRKRLEKERKEMKQRVDREMKAGAERAEIAGRVWEDQVAQWEAALKFVDIQWSAGIEGGHSALKNAASEIKQLVAHHAGRPYYWEEPRIRLTFVEPLRRRLRHWHNQRENERLEMDVTIKRISDADDSRLNYAYQYPQTGSFAAARFVTLKYEESFSKIHSATVYDSDVKGAIESAVHDVIRKSTTRSVINVDRHWVDPIPENDHLLYLGSDKDEPAFIQRNRGQWWDKQTRNSSTYYFTPDGVFNDSAIGYGGTIAHIFIFLKTPSRVQLRLLHRQSRIVSVSIQENGTELRVISTDEIADIESEEFQLENFDLGHFEPGRHELKLVVTRMGTYSAYYLRDVFVDFNHDRPSYNLLYNVVKDLEAIVVHGGADTEPNQTEDAI